MQYRPEIDGLRALAVIPVILFHAGIASFPGGFIGVDIFFVISGYLITSIILQDLETGEFSLTDFYQRRARRILPALFFVTAACIPLAWYWLPPADMEDFAQSVLAVLAFASNFLFWIESGYFETASELKPLLHTWSLAIEEQFYLLYPLALLFLWRVSRRRMTPTLLLLTLLSLALAQWTVLRWPAAAFYLLPTRGWELLLGALCALHLDRRTGIPGNALALDGLCLLALAAIAFAVFRFDEFTPVPGIAALLPTASTAILILCSGNSRWCRQLLALRPVVFTGLISYSAYLWHQPLLVFARHASIDTPAPALVGGLIVLSFVLAFTTWKFVETPFRRAPRIAGRPALAAALFAAGAFYLFGFYGTSDAGLQRRFAPVEAELAGYYDGDADLGADPSPCLLTFPVGEQSLARCLDFAGSRYAVLIGDSHAESLSLALREELAARGIGLLSFVENGCLPIPETARLPLRAYSKCRQFKDEVFGLLPALQPEFLIFSARWAIYLNASTFDNREGGSEQARDFSYVATTASGDRPLESDLVEHMALKLAELARRHRLLLISQIPEAGWNVPRRIRTLLMKHRQDIEMGTSYSVYRERNRDLGRLLDRLSGVVRVVAAEEIVCGVRMADRCENILDGKSLYRDNNHPSYSYARKIARKAMDALALQAD